MIYISLSHPIKLKIDFLIYTIFSMCTHSDCSSKVFFWSSFNSWQYWWLCQSSAKSSPELPQDPLIPSLELLWRPLSKSEPCLYLKTINENLPGFSNINWYFTYIFLFLLQIVFIHFLSYHSLNMALASPSTATLTNASLGATCYSLSRSNMICRKLLLQSEKNCLLKKD